MCVLVIGGAGFIGSHVCQALKNQGFTPVTYDDLSSGHEWAIQFGPFVKGAIEDEKRLKHTIDHFKPFAVIHLAGLINVRDSILFPEMFYQTLGGTVSLLKVLVQTKIKYLVFSSTAAVYGKPCYLPIDEEHPKAPLNAYGKLKWMIEEMLEDFHSAYGLQYAALRYFNACGADLEAKIGEAHTPETHLIPLAIEVALKKRAALEIFGDDYNTKDGTAIRDYIHVLDLADAHVKALGCLVEQGGKLRLNLGTGTGYSVKEVLSEVELFSKKRLSVKILPKYKQDSPSLIADSSLAKKVLQWTPVHSDLPTIISSAWNWHVSSRFPSKKALEKLLETVLH